MSHRALGPQFHSTVNEDWPPKDDWVHVGTEGAARHRMRDFDEDYFEERLAGKPLDQARWKVHRVAITGPVYPHTITDDEANDVAGIGFMGTARAVSSEHGYPTPSEHYRAFPYSNTHEDAGAPSYLVHTSALRVLGTEHTNEPVRRRR